MISCFETRRRSPAGLAAALILLGLLLWPKLAAAESEPAQRVLLVAPAEAELTARILGQTRDLGVSLEVVDSADPKDAQAAAEVGRAHDAAIVVWTEAHGSAGLDVHVLELAHGQLRTRHVSTPERETLASSTTAEMAALAIRGELSALLSELEAARAQAQLEPAPPPQEEEPPAPIVPVARAPAPAAKLPAQPPWLVAVGYRPSRPLPDTVMHGFSLGLRRDLGGFAVGLAAIGNLPLTRSKGGTEIRLTRLELRLEGLKHWRVSRKVSLLAGVAASMSYDLRSTERVEAPLVRTSDDGTLSFGFGALGELQWMFSRRVGGLLGLGADLVPWRTEFIYQDEGSVGTVARLSWLDIWGLVGLFTRFGT